MKRSGRDSIGCRFDGLTTTPSHHTGHYIAEIIMGDRGSNATYKQDRSEHSVTCMQVVRHIVKPGFHPNAIACVACVAFGWIAFNLLLYGSKDG